MKLFLPFMRSGRIKLIRIKDVNGRYVAGSCVLRDMDIDDVSILRRGEVMSVVRRKTIKLSTWEIWCLFVWSLFGYKEHNL